VQRVASRWDGVIEAVDSKAGAQAVQAIANAWLDSTAPGRHNQAVMEVGALVCTPKAPE
jgi:A/G-specific adenine glycosylase